MKNKNILDIKMFLLNKKQDIETPISSHHRDYWAFFSYFLLFLLGVVIYSYNSYTPLLLDDCGYGSNIKSFSDIVQFQKEHYFTTNGRFLTHTIVQLFAGLWGKNIFNIANTLVYLAMIISLLKITNVSLKNLKGATILLILITILWFFLPDQYITSFMIAGSLNNIWATVFVLFFLYHYMKFVKQTDHKYNTLLYVGLCFYAFLSSILVELYSIPLFPTMFIATLFIYKKRSPRVVILLLFFLVGTLIITLAPGNFIRFSKTGMEKISLAKQIFNFSILYFTTAYPYVVLGIILYYRWIIKRKIKYFFIENSFWLIFMIISLGFIMLSGAWYDRVFFAHFIFLVIIIINVLSKTPTRYYQIGYFIVIPILLIFLSVSMYNHSQTLSHNKLIVDTLIKELKNSSQKTVKLNNILQKTNKGFDTNAFSMEFDNWKNIFFARYYQIDSLSVLPNEIYDSLYLAPNLINSKNIVFPNGYTTSTLDYYICPIKKNQLPIESIDLVYSQNDTLMLVNKIDYLIQKFGFEDFIPYYYPHTESPPPSNFIPK